MHPSLIDFLTGGLTQFTWWELALVLLVCLSLIHI